MTDKIDSPLPIPFHMRLTLRSRIDDHLLHLLEFGVVGVRNPSKLLIGSEMFSDAFVERRIAHAGIALPSNLIDALALRCFTRLSNTMIELGGTCATWTMANIAPWLAREFDAELARQFVETLSDHVTPGLIAQDECVVGDDDVVLADDLRRTAFGRGGLNDK